MSPATAIHNVRVFDGTKILPYGTVVFQDGTIMAIGDERAIPLGARVIDGTSHTLLPGLIDAHTHVFDKTNLQQALKIGRAHV